MEKIVTTDIIKQAIALKDTGISWINLPAELEKQIGFNIKADTLRAAMNRAGYKIQKFKVEQATDVKAEILKSAEKGIDRENLKLNLKISDKILNAYLEEIKEDGLQIEEVAGQIRISRLISPQNNVIKKNWRGEEIIRFGIVSDTHIGSKHQQITLLNDFYDICQKEGITDIYHSGDITEGYNMRKGQEYEVFCHGTDEQADYVIKNYPFREGLTTHFITGNHDHSGIKSSGVDIGRLIARERKDMVYLGLSNAKVHLTPNCVMELNHPLDGASYALSYTLQKFIDSMSGGEKPNILINGHHHKAMYVFYRNIHAIEAGCFEAQTPWMRGKRLSAHVGGWIVEVAVSEDGTIKRFKQEFIPYYKSVEKDY